VVALGAFVALENLRVFIPALAGVGAILAVGVGFAPQNTAQNFVSGLILLLERPVKKGDFVEGGDVRGTVCDIRACATVVTTLDNVDIIVASEMRFTIDQSFRAEEIEIPFPSATCTCAPALRPPDPSLPPPRYGGIASLQRSAPGPRTTARSTKMPAASDPIAKSRMLRVAWGTDHSAKRRCHLHGITDRPIVVTTITHPNTAKRPGNFICGAYSTSAVPTTSRTNISRK
jgi:hypothetical protein